MPDRTFLLFFFLFFAASAFAGAAPEGAVLIPNHDFSEGASGFSFLSTDAVSGEKTSTQRYQQPGIFCASAGSNELYDTGAACAGKNLFAATDDRLLLCCREAEHPDCTGSNAVLEIVSQAVEVQKSAGFLCMDRRLAEYDGYSNSTAEIAARNPLTGKETLLETSRQVARWNASDTGWQKKCYNLSQLAGERIEIICRARDNVANGNCEGAWCSIDNIYFTPVPDAPVENEKNPYGLLALLQSIFSGLIDFIISILHMIFPEQTPTSGACCSPSGICNIAPEKACIQAGGSFKGSVASCSQGTCPQPAKGACCSASGYCNIVSAGSCAGVGGIFKGDGTTCEPNPCPQPERGACCSKSGYCNIVSRKSCEGVSGIFKGDKTSCEPNPC